MKIDDENVDFFPTAEAIFRDFEDEMKMLQNRRRNIVFVFVCTLIGIFLFSFFAIPLFLEVKKLE